MSSTDGDKKRRSKRPKDEPEDDDASYEDDGIGGGGSGGGDHDAKLLARREANRMHALKSRQRSKLLLSELQQTVAQLTNDKGALERQNAVLRAQVEVLQQQNRALLQSQQHLMMMPQPSANAVVSATQPGAPALNNAGAVMSLAGLMGLLQGAVGGAVAQSMPPPQSAPQLQLQQQQQQQQQASPMMNFALTMPQQGQTQVPPFPQQSESKPSVSDGSNSSQQQQQQLSNPSAGVQSPNPLASLQNFIGQLPPGLNLADFFQQGQMSSLPVTTSTSVAQQNPQMDASVSTASNTSVPDSNDMNMQQQQALFLQHLQQQQQPHHQQQQSSQQQQNPFYFLQQQQPQSQTGLNDGSNGNGHGNTTVDV
jgi:hypothetical protein